MSSLHALVVPGDRAPDVTSLKRHFLFFSSISLVDPSDRALVNEKEVSEKFPMGTFVWSERNPFPRADDYEHEIREVFADTRDLQRQGLVRVISRTSHPFVDPGMNYVLWHGAIADDKIVNAAAPDASFETRPPNKWLAGYMQNLLITQSGHRSRYEIANCPPAHMISGVPEEWSLVAHLRVGRALKYWRCAYGKSLCPLSLDPINSAVLAAITGSRVSSNQSTPDLLAQMALSLEVFDPAELNTTLRDMSWDDVSRLRKETLPGAKELHSKLIKHGARLSSAHAANFATYVAELQKLREDLDDKKEQLAEKWQKLRIASVLKGSTGSSAGLATSAVINPGVGWIDLGIHLAAMAAAAGTALSSELTALIPAREKVRTHPLFFLDQIGGAR